MSNLLRNALAVFGFCVVVLIIGVCAACGDDDDGEDASLVWFHGGDDKRDDNRNENGRDCHQARAQCSDDDFSPSFEDSPVEDSFNPTVCLPLSRCETRPEDPAEG